MHLGESCVARAELPQSAQALLPPVWNLLPSLPDPEALPASVRTLRASLGGTCRPSTAGLCVADGSPRPSEKEAF